MKAYNVSVRVPTGHIDVIAVRARNKHHAKQTVLSLIEDPEEFVPFGVIEGIEAADEQRGDTALGFILGCLYMAVVASLLLLGIAIGASQ